MKPTCCGSKVKCFPLNTVSAVYCMKRTGQILMSFWSAHTRLSCSISQTSVPQQTNFLLSPASLTSFYSRLHTKDTKYWMPLSSLLILQFSFYSTPAMFTEVTISLNALWFIICYFYNKLTQMSSVHPCARKSFIYFYLIFIATRCQIYSFSEDQLFLFQENRSF